MCSSEVRVAIDCFFELVSRLLIIALPQVGDTEFLIDLGRFFRFATGDASPLVCVVTQPTRPSVATNAIARRNVMSESLCEWIFVPWV